MENGVVVVISAPSGSGKTTICRMLPQRVENIHLSVSYTTRPRKEGEVEGKDYYFVKPEIFDKMIVSREFLECASVCGTRYGTSREAVRTIVSRGWDAVLEIDVQGGRKVKQDLPEAVLVGISPPDWKSVETRLTGRGRDTSEEMKARLRAAADEARQLLSYDYLVVNDDLGAAVTRGGWVGGGGRVDRHAPAKGHAHRGGAPGDRPGDGAGQAITPERAMLRLNDIVDRVQSIRPAANIELIQKAYVFTGKVHHGQLRESGEPYLIHPLNVSHILADWNMDEEAVATGPVPARE